MTLSSLRATRACARNPIRTSPRNWLASIREPPRYMRSSQEPANGSPRRWLPQPSGVGFEFLFAGLPDSVQYYVESNGVRSKTYNLTAVEIPGIKKLRVTYNYPKWAGLKPAVEEPGGDLRAIEGTEATVAIETDKPLKSAVIILDNGERIEMQKGEANWLSASVPIKSDGMYHIATVDKSEDIRLSDDYFIEAQKEQPPKVKIARPARDFKVNPIEEVTVQVEAEDDFALQDVVLSYSVNGGPEKNVSLLKHKGAKTAEGETMLSLEDFKLVPGDVVALACPRTGRAVGDHDRHHVP